MTVGSSPLARGGPSSARYAHSPPRAHPRWRGADWDDEPGDYERMGSSPLARGGRALGRDGGVHVGLIPAGAGRTPDPHLDGVQPRAHPRWRGADGALRGSWTCEGGSSPLARGGPIPIASSTTGSGAHPRWRGADTCRLGKISSLLVILDHFRARRRRLALLQPGRMAGSGSGSIGRRISVTPSTSTGSHVWLWTLKLSPWSPRQLNTMSARPSLHMSRTWPQRRSLTRALMRPQKTPGLISRSHRVRCPRRPAGQAVRTSTTMAVHRRRSSDLLLCARACPRFRRHPRGSPCLPLQANREGGVGP